MTMMHDQSSSGDEQAARMLKRKSGDKPDIGGKPHKKSKHTRASKAKWTPEEDEILTRAVLMSGEGNWKKIAQSLHDRSHLQCLHRWQKVLNPALVKGPWKEEEDAKLSELVEKYGPKDWSTIAGHIPGRIGKQCRERWFNHLSPDVRKTNWTPEEDKIIIDAHSKVGNKWTNISKLLDGRPANAIKNHWNSTLLKRIQDSNGEPTPRRDRNRTKKPPPLRATEFDFRTQLLQQQQQQFEDSSDCSPQHYSHSPVSSPDSYPQHHQETPLANTVRFHIPDAPHVFFANPFNTEMQHHPNTITAVPTGTMWDSWPAPNIIHLTHPPAAIPAVSHGINFGHLAGIHAPQHLTTPLASNFSFNNHPNNHTNHIITTTTPNNAVLNAMHNASYDTDSYSSSSLSETSSPEDFMADPYLSSGQSSPFPSELQYCFDSQQNAEAVQYEGVHSASLPVDSSGMINGHLSGGMNISNLGLLGLDLPAFPLEL